MNSVAANNVSGARVSIGVGTAPTLRDAACPVSMRIQCCHLRGDVPEITRFAAMAPASVAAVR